MKVIHVTDKPYSQTHQLGYWYVPGYILFALMLFLPTTYTSFKAIWMAICLGILLVSILNSGKIRLHPTVFSFGFFYILLGAVLVLRAVIINTPGGLRVSTVFVLWPAIYLLYVSAISKPRVLVILLKIIVWITVAICLYGLVYILTNMSLIPSFLYIPIDVGQKFVVHGSRITFRIHSVTTLIFSLPFLISLTLIQLRQPKADHLIAMPILWVAILASIIIIFLRSVGSIILVTLLSPVIHYIFSFILKKGSLRKGLGLKWVLFIIGFLFAAFVITNLFNVDIVSFWRQEVLGSIDPELDPGAQIRLDQFYALWADWRSSPLLGIGLGQVSRSYVRAPDTPWAYELTYIALLAQIGLIGILSYGFGFIWLYWKSFQIIRSKTYLSSLMLPVLVGLTCFLLANATNPFLLKYDFLWVIFLPIAFVNCFNIYRDKS